MSLEKKEVVDKIEVLEDNRIQIRTATVIMDDDNEISRSFHRHVIAPGDNITDENEKVQVIASAIWID